MSSNELEQALNLDGTNWLEIFQDLKCIMGLDPYEELLAILVCEYGDDEGTAMWVHIINSYEHFMGYGKGSPITFSSAGYLTRYEPWKKL